MCSQGTQPPTALPRDSQLCWAEILFGVAPAERAGRCEQAADTGLSFHSLLSGSFKLIYTVGA